MVCHSFAHRRLRCACSLLLRHRARLARSCRRLATPGALASFACRAACGERRSYGHSARVAFSERGHVYGGRAINQHTRLLRSFLAWFRRSASGWLIPSISSLTALGNTFLGIATSYLSRACMLRLFVGMRAYRTRQHLLFNARVPRSHRHNIRYLVASLPRLHACAGGLALSLAVLALARASSPSSYVASLVEHLFLLYAFIAQVTSLAADYGYTPLLRIVRATLFFFFFVSSATSALSPSRYSLPLFRLHLPRFHTYLMFRYALGA